VAQLLLCSTAGRKATSANLLVFAPEARQTKCKYNTHMHHISLIEPSFFLTDARPPADGLLGFVVGFLGAVAALGCGGWSSGGSA
jgi:hypothetical protein